MTQPDADKLSLVLDEDGDEFAFWTDATISDSFLEPCQTMSLSVGVDETRFDVLSKFQIGTRFTVRVNGNPVMSGLLDSAECKRSRSGGVNLVVTGRDILSPAVDSNIDPRMQVSKEMSLVDLAMKVFVEEFHLPIIVFDDEGDDGPSKARNLSLGKPVSSKPRKGKKKARDPMKDLRPHPNEGGFQYFTRFSHRIGFHAWATPDGSNVVIGTPTWDQEPAYQFRGLRSIGIEGKGALNNIEDSSAKLDYTHVPSHVFVRGKSTKPGDKSQPIGYAEFPPAAYFKPFYITDPESNSPDHANAVARFTLGKALRTSLDYRLTVRGLSDPATGRVYTVDTVADCSDELVGINGNMWVEQRTFRKSRQGMWTDLKLLPANALLMDYYAAESPPPPPENYKAAAAAMKPKKGTRSRNGWDLYVITWDEKSQAQTTDVVDFGTRPFK